MKKLILICSSLLLFTVTLSYAELTIQNDSQTNPIAIDGSSFEKAVIIKYIGKGAFNMDDYGKTIHQEYDYLSNKFGVRGKDWRLLKQSVKHNEGKVYDEMIIEFPSRETRILYFDITEPFNKLIKANSASVQK